MLRDIKDRSPNEALIKQLESLLESAKAGELRTVVYLCMWDDDQVSHGWSIDRRNSRRRLIGEMAMLNFDMLVNQSFADGDTALSQAFEDG